MAEQSETSTTRAAARLEALRALRGIRGHIARALVPALALAVIAGGTAGAVTVVALSGAVVETDDADDADDAADGVAEDVGADDATGDDALLAAAGTNEATDAAEGADDGEGDGATDGASDDAPTDDEEPVLSFEETVAAHGRPDYTAILSRMFPGAEWSLNGSTYAGLRWLDGSAKPTRAELDALWPEVAAALAKERAAQEAAAEAAEAARAAELEARRNDPSVQALVDSIDPRAIWGPEPDYSAILSRRFPGAQWSLNGNDPAGGLVWHDGGTAPTKAQLDAMWAEVAREMALEMDPAELARHAGVGDQVYVEGVLRPKGWVGGANDPQPEGSVNAGVDYRYLPQIPNSNGGSPVGTLDILKDPTGSQNFEQKYGMDLTDLAARIAAAHGYFGGSHGLGLSLNGDKELMWYSDQVDPEIVRGVLEEIGAVTAPAPEPEPEPAPEADPEPTPEAEAAPEDPAADEPGAEEPAADDPAPAEEPVAEEPATEEPAAEE